MMNLEVFKNLLYVCITYRVSWKHQTIHRILVWPTEITLQQTFTYKITRFVNVFFNNLYIVHVYLSFKAFQVCFFNSYSKTSYLNKHKPIKSTFKIMICFIKEIHNKNMQSETLLQHIKCSDWTIVEF